MSIMRETVQSSRVSVVLPDGRVFQNLMAVEAGFAVGYHGMGVPNPYSSEEAEHWCFVYGLTSGKADRIS